jgi:hypothetical protein
MGRVVFLILIGVVIGAIIMTLMRRKGGGDR